MVMDLTNMAGGLREHKKQATRAALQHSAVTLCRQRGPGAVTVEDICADAGVSPRTFFNYFATKEEAVFSLDDGVPGCDSLSGFAEFSDGECVDAGHGRHQPEHDRQGHELESGPRRTEAVVARRRRPHGPAARAGENEQRRRYDRSPSHLLGSRVQVLTQ